MEAATPTEEIRSSDNDGLFAPEQKEEAVELFLFELDNELYAVSVREIDQVMKIPPVTSVPNAPESILGIFHLRGKVIVAIDLLKRMHIKRLSSFVPLYLFVSHMQKNYFAVVVDRVFSVILVPKREVTTITPLISTKVNAAYVHGMFMYREPLKKRRHTEDFMIQPKGSMVQDTPPEAPSRPVLWLNIALLLDQTDILRLQANPSVEQVHNGQDMIQ